MADLATMGIEAARHSFLDDAALARAEAAIRAFERDRIRTAP